MQWAASFPNCTPHRHPVLPRKKMRGNPLSLNEPYAILRFKKKKTDSTPPTVFYFSWCEGQSGRRGGKGGTSTVQWEAKQPQVLNSCHVTRKKTKNEKRRERERTGLPPPLPGCRFYHPAPFRLPSVWRKVK